MVAVIGLFVNLAVSGGFGQAINAMAISAGRCCTLSCDYLVSVGAIAAAVGDHAHGLDGPRSAFYLMFVALLVVRSAGDCDGFGAGFAARGSARSERGSCGARAGGVAGNQYTRPSLFSSFKSGSALPHGFVPIFDRKP